MNTIDYKKYRWFFTSSSKLVVGGKSSLQNDELLKKVKSLHTEFIVMHTSSPGSPFCIILDSIEKVDQQDIEETAIFTGCFSRAWKEMKKTTVIDIFYLSQLYKTVATKSGTWGVKGEIKRKMVPLQLVLTKQEGKLRAVPQSSKKNAIKIRPGKVDKSSMLLKLQVSMHEHFSPDEILSALPPGGVTIVREK